MIRHFRGIKVFYDLLKYLRSYMDNSGRFRLVLEGEASKKMPELPLLELSEKTSANNFAYQVQMAKPQDH